MKRNYIKGLIIILLFSNCCVGLGYAGQCKSVKGCRTVFCPKRHPGWSEAKCAALCERRCPHR